MLETLKDLIEGGFLGQAIIATLVWGGIVLLLVQRNPVDDRLYDAGYIVLGYFFHVAQMAVATHKTAQLQRATHDCQDELENGRN